MLNHLNRSVLVRSLFLSFLSILIHITDSHLTPNPVVQINSGRLKGSLLKSWTNKTFYSFRGVPFAEAPIRKLRFKAPVEIKSWTGIKNATEDGKICPQLESEALGPDDEDCLYLNVYSQNLKGNRPVIVYFHPGGYFLYTGASYWAGPQYLMDHDIVLVTANYRLDALGFLSTGDKVATGNYGMKDQVLVLRWVKKNIRNFGGDPNKVTIAGYSAGSTSAFLHMLSPMSKGLFHGIIGMSSGVTSEWVIMQEPKTITLRLAKFFNCSSSESSDKVIECLRNVPANDLISKYNDIRVFAGNPVVFTPSIEPDFGTNEERFLTDDPVKLIKNRQFHQVPIVTGINSNEFWGYSYYIFMNETLGNRLIKEFDSLAPVMFGYTRKNASESQRITDTFKKFYFENNPINNNTKSIDAFGKWFSDFSIIYNQYSTAKLFAKYSSKPVYFYVLSYKGRYSYYDCTSSNSLSIGPCHMDDLLYLFYNSKDFPLLKPTDPESFMVKIETSFWKNFATTGNPTPDQSPVQWIPINKNEEIKYLNIDVQLTMQNWIKSTFSERMKIWNNLFPILN